MAKKKKYVKTPSGAIGTNTASAMLGLAQASGTTTPGTYAVQGGQVVPVPQQPPSWEQQQAQVTAQRNVGVNDLYSTWQQGNLDQDYGFGAGGAANPYSQAALLQENFRRAKRGTLNSAGNQLYSGSYQRAQNENQRNYDIGYDRLRRDYDRQSGDIQFGRLQTYADAGMGVDDATFQALLSKLRGL